MHNNLEQFTIFSLEIPAANFDKEDLEYLGDNKDDEEPEEEGPPASKPATMAEAG
jgi:hypothetical protein